jgi:hypothetical protein
MPFCALCASVVILNPQIHNSQSCAILDKIFPRTNTSFPRHELELHKLQHFLSFVDASAWHGICLILVALHEGGKEPSYVAGS